MGTYIALNIGGIDVAWAKNRMGENFGALYEETNRKPLRESTEENDLTGSIYCNYWEVATEFIYPTQKTNR